MPWHCQGKALAEKNCVTCHAVGAAGDSTLRDAPPFRDIAANYDEGELEDAFNDGVVTQHPAMPDWQMTPEQAAALAAYIMSLGTPRHEENRSAAIAVLSLGAILR